MEIGVGLDVVKLAGFDQRTKNGPSMATAIAAGEEMILATECNRPDRPFNRVGIEFDAAIMQEARQSVPARECVADRFGNRAAAWYKRKLLFEPEPHRLDDALGAIAASREPVPRRLAANVGFNGIEFGDPAECFGRDRRVGCLRHLVELAPCMTPACGEHDVALACQGFEAGIATCKTPLKCSRCEAGRSALRSGAYTKTAAGGSGPLQPRCS